MLSILLIMIDVTTYILNLSKSKVYLYLYLALDNIRTLENLKSIQPTLNLYASIVEYLFSVKTPRKVLLLFTVYLSLFTYLTLSLFFFLPSNSELLSGTTLILF